MHTLVLAALLASAGVEAFNDSFREATRRMDNAAVVALWDEQGVSLLPSTPPIIGRAAIAAFLDQATSGLRGAHMKSFELECHDVDVSGDWASEWCTEHQVVAIPGKPDFDGRGKLLLVLHRGADQKWRLRREMWNAQ